MTRAMVPRRRWPTALESDDLPPLPATLVLKDGQRVSTIERVWTMRSNADGGVRLTLRWSDLLDGRRGVPFSQRAYRMAQLLFVARGPHVMAATISNDLSTLLRLSEWLATGPGRIHLDGASVFDWTLLDEGLCRAFLAHGMETPTQGNDFARLRELYRTGCTMYDFADFHHDRYLVLTSVTAKGNLKGRAVRGGDPMKGELTADEVDAVAGALNAGRGPRRHRIFVRLCLELGQNPTQYTRMTNGHLHRYARTERRVSASGEPYDAEMVWYHVEVPRNKKRGRQRLADGAVVTTTWPISRALGDELVAEQRGDAADPLLWWVAAAVGRNAGSFVYAMIMQEWVEAAGVLSSRTGMLLHLSPRRFRTTMATNAADEGAPPAKLAQLLDHSDTQHVGVYLDTSPAFLERFNGRVDEAYAPLVRRFQGQLASRAMATGPDGRPAPVIPGTAIHLPLLNADGIGLCGKRGGLCGQAATLTCYTCPSFIAFTDGPHGEVVDALQQTMDAMAAAGTDVRIPLQLSRSLAGAREVVRLIHERAVAP